MAVEVVRAAGVDRSSGRERVNGVPGKEVASLVCPSVV